VKVRRTTYLLLALAALGLLVPGMTARSARAAENITRKREKPVSGEVSGVSRTEVTVKVKTPKEDTIKIPANDVQNISWTGEPPEANLARSDEASGKYQRAIDGYQKSLQNSKATNPLSKADLEYGITRSTAKMALLDPSHQDEAIKRLEEFRSKQSDHYRFYEAVGLLGELYLAKKELVKAQLAFDTLAKAPWKESQLAAKIASGRLLQVDNKLDDAVAAFESVISQAPEGRGEESLQQEARLGKARVLILQKKFEEAQTLLEAVIAQAAPDDARVMAEAYVRLGDCLREQSKDKDALLAYLHVDVLFGSEKALQAEALFHLSRLWEKVGQKGRAAEARDRLEGEEFRNTEWVRQLKTPAAG
jgi:tetratricopeptide (TPR) repeat protein